MGIVESIHLTAFHWVVDDLHRGSDHPQACGRAVGVAHALSRHRNRRHQTATRHRPRRRHAARPLARHRRRRRRRPRASASRSPPPCPNCSPRPGSTASSCAASASASAARWTMPRAPSSSRTRSRAGTISRWPTGWASWSACPAVLGNDADVAGSGRGAVRGGQGPVADLLHHDRLRHRRRADHQRRDLPRLRPGRGGDRAPAQPGLLRESLAIARAA